MVNLELDVSKHLLVPKHEILKGKEVKKLLERLQIKEEQLPRILVSDPMVKAIGAVQGNIIRITRKSETAGEIYYYRFVVEE